MEGLHGKDGQTGVEPGHRASSMRLGAWMFPRSNWESGQGQKFWIRVFKHGSVSVAGGTDNLVPQGPDAPRGCGQDPGGGNGGG